MSFRPIALAILNGSLDDSVMVPYLDSLCEAGYGGVCWHPRDGLQVAYASRLFWQKLEHLTHLARQREMEVWFYDEFPFPSGSAGGLIPSEHPELLVRQLRFECIEPALTPHNLVNVGSGHLLALLRYREDATGQWCEVRDVTEDTGPHFDSWVWGEWHNLYYTATQRVHEVQHERAQTTNTVMAYSPLEPLEAGERLLAIKLELAPAPRHQAGMPDIVLPETTDLFLERIYQPYVALAKRQGLENVPIFQDEPYFYTIRPWNREIAARLQPLWGDEWRIHLAALHTVSLPDWELRRYEFRTAAAAALRENWFARVSRYCKNHGLRMTGHLPGEESIFGHWQLLGDFFGNLEQFDIPGFDIISWPTGDDENRSQTLGAKLVQSAAWLDGRKATMVETFGANGFHLDTQRMRTVVAWLSIFDIHQPVDHSAYVSTLSVRKYDAPPANNRFNPLFRGQQDLWDWHQWFRELLAENEFDPKILVLFPTDALARFCMEEKEQWSEATNLLETFFHTICAYSMDCIFLPPERLSEVEVEKDGFSLQGQTFHHFVVPPVASLHENTWNALENLRSSPGFCWVLPEEAEQEPRITLFGSENPNGKSVLVEAHAATFCTEGQLIETKSAWFEPLLGNVPVQTCETVLHTLRRSKNPARESDLLVLVNPHEHEVEVRINGAFAETLPQPPHNLAHSLKPVPDGDGWLLCLPPRDIVVLRQSRPEAAPKTTVMRELKPHQAAYRFLGPNHYSLKTGTSQLEGHEEQNFQPGTVSQRWKIDDLPYEATSGITAPTSIARLEAPLKLGATFPITLSGEINHLAVVLDAESLPPQYQLFWDETPLTPILRDVYEQGNTAFKIELAQLGAGTHSLKIEATVTTGAQGILERPILTGDFLVQSAEPLCFGPLEHGWQPFTESPMWTQLGIPEGFGPVETRFIFEVKEGTSACNLVLPECIGVVEIEVNGVFQGRSCWEPRRIQLNSLAPGTHEVTLRLFGSWNNLFSRLNSIENGLRGHPFLTFP